MITVRPQRRKWLDLSARLANRARPLSRPNPAVGCVIVRDGVVVGRGWTQPGGRPHAEALALAQAGDSAAGADIYVTLEPCAHTSERGPSCADLLIAASPRRVIIGVEDPDPRTAGKGLAKLKAAGIEAITLESAEARSSLAGYLIGKHFGRPYITLKLASSLDGRIALESGESQWITGREARAHCHMQRARQDAILVGGATWRKDTPRLDVRLAGLEKRSPQRYVLTSGPAPEGADGLTSPEAVHDMDGIQYLYIEGGAQTAAAFIRAKLVDRLELYRAPIVLGGDSLPMIDDLGLAELSAVQDQWQLCERRALGSDLFEAYEHTPCSPE